VGESKEFDTQLRAGENGGQTAQATVTVRGVKEKQVPELDDDFAQTASEFDTIEELKADVRSRLERIQLLTQGMTARDRVVEALLELVEVPVPEHVLGDEVAFRRQQIDEQLAAAGLEKAAYAEAEGKTVEELDAEVEETAKVAIASQFLLDAIARKEELGIEEVELTEQIVRRAQQAGIRPDEYAQQIVAQGQLGALMGEVMRGKALALLLDRATVTDASGRPVDLDALTPALNRADAAGIDDDEGDLDEQVVNALDELIDELEADDPDEATSDDADEVSTGDVAP
jgi:trigger factor